MDLGLLPTILLLCVATGVLSVIAASLVLAAPKPVIDKLLPHLISLAAGTLLGAAFIEILPHAFSHYGGQHPETLTLAVLGGLLAFFLLEKIVLWRHCHADPCEAHSLDHDPSQAAAGTLILVGDGLHNFVDGILIAAALLSDVRLGLVTTLAIVAHEIPQEVGDFFVLLNAGYSKARALAFNLLASATTIVGGLLGYYFLDSLRTFVPYVLAVAGASFLYIALTDLIPSLHKRAELKDTLQQMFFIVGGIALIWATHMSLG